MPVQSVLFDRDLWSQVKAIKFLKLHEKKYNKVDYTTNKMRFRQYNPKKNAKYITKNIANGVQYVIEIQ